MGKKLKKNWSQLIVILFLMYISFLAVNPIYGKEPDWLIKLKKLEVFKSTKTEIEKMFDHPEIIETYNSAEKEKNGWGEIIKYKTKDGMLKIEYSTGKCSETKSILGYDVEKDVAVELTFYPHKPIPFNDLGYDLKKFKYISVSDMWETYIFSNEELGVRIFIVDKRVENISFGFTDKSKKLYCKNTVK